MKIGNPFLLFDLDGTISDPIEGMEIMKEIWRKLRDSYKLRVIE